jgi:8-hydroxy-5-deazaflavin:NADPH oxidoreductase
MKTTTIGVLGASKMGFALGNAWARAGYQVRIGTATPNAFQNKTDSPFQVCSYEDAAQAADVLVIATTWQRSVAALQRVAPYAKGKVVLDCSNPEPESGTGLVIGHSTSAGEVHQSVIPDAHVVKALNHLYAEILEQRGQINGERATCFYCSDSAEAVSQAKELIEALGMDAVFAGALRVARYLEPLAALIVELVRAQGHDPAQTAFRLLREVRS